MKQIALKTRFPRRIPDPVFTGCTRHIFLCSVEDVPQGIPTKPNPREQNIDRGIYRDIQKHLLNVEGEANTFHLKNKGITILADKVEQLDKSEDFAVWLSDEQGIVDGGHTYGLVIRNQPEIARMTLAGEDIRQFVKIEVLTGYDPKFITEIAGGLNTAVQVQRMSLENLEGGFDWLKEELRDEPYLKQIAFRQGENRLFDVRDILVLLDLFNTSEFPAGFASTKHPIRAYSAKESVLKAYQNNPKNYENLRPILRDILSLHDIISSQAAERYNKSSGGRGGKLKVVEYSREKQAFDFPFIGTQGQYRLFRSVLFPMLGAFRYMVQLDPTSNQATWRGGFESVLKLWEIAALSLMEASKGTCQELGYNLNGMGKSPNHWQALYFIVLQNAMQNGL